jgi:hypothetical protein
VDIIHTQQDILDLIGLCGEAGSNRVLISDGSLHPDFFDLSTGTAGEITLKLSTYRIKTAFMIDLALISSVRFQEWAAECNRGQEIHFWADESEAESWLLDE